MKEKVRILVINTGSTSTKLAVYDNDKVLCSSNIDYTNEELGAFAGVLEQKEFRKKAVIRFLENNNIKESSIDVIASRGGAFEIFQGGAYLIDEQIAELASTVRDGFTPNGSWLAASISYDLAQKWGIKAYFYDAVFTDELCDIARYSGISFIKRRPGGHPLNCKEVARREAKAMGKQLKDTTFIICHMGGGISTELHRYGKIDDFISFTEGTFTPERAGRVPSNALIDLVYSGKFPDKKSLMKFMRGKGGLVDYLGTNSVLEVEKRIDAGDKEAENVLKAMCYQISKDIGTMAAAAQGKVDKILLTGGIAKSPRITHWIRENVEFIAPVEIYAGSFEMDALANGILRVYQGKETAKIYNKK